MAMTMPPGSVRDSLAHPAASSTSPMADGKIQTPFSEITSPGGLKCQEFGGRRGFEERQVPRQERFGGTCGRSIEKLLTAIAREGAGGNAGDDLTAAMNEGFGPILMDRLLHSTAANRIRMEESWATAISNVGQEPDLNLAECGALNAMASVSTHDIENVSVGSRGAICDIPGYLESDEGFVEYFGASKENVLRTFVDLKPEANRVRAGLSRADKRELRAELQEHCNFRLVGLSAACDHVWGRVPVKKLLLAVELPSRYLDNCDSVEHGAVYETPLFLDPNGGGEMKLVFNWRYYLATAGNLEGCAVRYRLREPLVSHMATSYHVYGFRLGTPNYRTKAG